MFVTQILTPLLYEEICFETHCAIDNLAAGSLVS